MSSVLTLTLPETCRIAQLQSIAREGLNQIKQQSPERLIIDCAPLHDGDSSVLALIVTWLEDCQARKIPARILNWPEPLTDTAEAAGVYSWFSQFFSTD